MCLWRGRRQGGIGGGFSRSCEEGVEWGGGVSFLLGGGFLSLGLLSLSWWDDRLEQD